MSTPSSFLIALADAWQIPADNDAALLNDIVNFLREKEMLLLLDNFEHLLDVADVLALILAQAPLVKLLVTSQKRLNLREEWVFDLDGLPYPDAETIVSTETAVPPDSFAAVQLFLQHAHRLRRAFQPTVADFQAIARTCQIVDGTPLGIELAAAAIRRHSCPEIARQLARRLDFLAEGAPRNAPQRHHSLRAVFDYSWQLLTTAEQMAARYLSLFRSPITMAAAVTVAQTTPATLSALVDNALLRLTTHSDAEARFEMHSVVRQFARAALADRPADELAARDRHAHYYAQFLYEQRARLHSSQQQDAITAVNVEIEDVRAAWTWIISQKRWSDLDLALDGLCWFYWLCNWMQAGEAALAQAAAALAQAAEMDDLLLARIQARQADFSCWLSQYDAAQTLFAASLPVLRARQAWGDLAWALNTQGTMAYFQGEFNAAWQDLQKALAFFRQAGDRAGAAYAINNLGNVACDDQADYVAAVRLYQESLTIYQELGDLIGQAKCLINLGGVAQMQGDAAAARRLYQEGIDICRRLDNRMALAIALNNLGQLEADQGAYDVGETLLQESLDIKREIGDRRSLVFALQQLGAVTRQTGRLRQAQAYLGEALTTSRELGTAVLMANVLTEVASLDVAQNRPERALLLLAAVQRHVPQDQEIVNKAISLWQEISALLPPDVVAGRRRQGEEMGLETAVALVLNDFRAG